MVTRFVINFILFFTRLICFLELTQIFTAFVVQVSINELGEFRLVVQQLYIRAGLHYTTALEHYDLVTLAQEAH